MGVIVVASLLCFVNLILWIILAVRFKKIFTKDNIIEEYREELNNMLRDLNGNVERDINLVQEAQRNLKAVAAEADRRVKILQNELDKKQAATDLQKRISDARRAESQSEFLPKEEKTAKKAKASPKKTGTKASAKKAVTPIEKYKAEQMQGNLFISDASDDKGQAALSEGVGNAEQAALFANPYTQQVPVVRPAEYISDIPAAKDFNTLVRLKHEEGKTIPQIASELGTSIQEVKLSLQFLG